MKDFLRKLPTLKNAEVSEEEEFILPPLAVAERPSGSRSTSAISPKKMQKIGLQKKLFFE